MHYKRYLTAASVTVIAGTVAVSTVAASASVARPRLASAPSAAHSRILPKITIAMNG